MKRIGFYLLTVLSVLFIIGCSAGNDTGKDGEKSSTDSKASGVSTDGTLNLVNIDANGFGDRIEPLWLNRGGMDQRLLFRSLFLPDVDLQNLNSDLAEDHSVSDDGLTYTITMKDDVKWHDGEALTADDVIWSIETVLKATQVNAIYTNAFSSIVGAEDWVGGDSDSLSGITAEGNVITVNLDNPVGNFLPVLGQFAIYPKHLLKDENPLEIHNAAFWENPVGNGMYKLEKLEPGNFATLVPADTYEGTKPKIQKIVVTAVAEPTSAAKTGKVDFFNTNVAEFVDSMEEVEGYAAHPIDILFYRYFLVNIKDADGNVNEKMADKRVREALMYGIDRKSLTEQLYPGLAATLNTGVPPNFDESYADAPEYEFNPEKAKELLEEANFDFSETVKLRFYYGDQTSINFMTAVAQYLTELGMKVDVLQFQADPTTELYTVKDYDIALKGLSSFGYEEWYGEYESSNSNMVNIFGDEGVFDSEVNKLKQTVDIEERETILQDLQKLEVENLYKLPLYTVNSYYYVNEEKLKTSGIYGNPWYNYDMKFEEWEIK